MKKILTVVLALVCVMVFALTGCSTTPAAASTAAASAEASTAATAAASEAAATTEAAASAASASGEPTLIGGSIFTLQYAWFLGAKQGMEQWAVENPDANVKFQFEDSNQDIQTCITNLENMASAGCKGIVIFPVDSSAIIPTMVDLHNNKDITFVVGDYAQQPESDDQIVWDTFVGHDMVALGEAAGQVAVDYLDTLNKADPTLLFITTPTSGEVTKQRLQGFSDVVLAKYPKAKIIEEGDTGGGDRNSSQTLMENLLQRESSIDVVCGHNDAEVIGAYNAAVGAGRTEMKFIGIAGDKEVLKYLQDGNKMWIGEVLQDPVILGYTAMDALWKAMQGEDLPDSYDLPKPQAVTPANIKDTDWQSWEWLG